MKHSIKCYMKHIGVLLCLLFAFAAPVSAKVSASQIAVVVNVNDTDSRLIAAYYQKKRGIPKQNIIEVRFPAGQNSISEATFNKFYQQVIDKTPESVQFYALAWTQPFKVECMSVTSAFAFGFDKRYCAKGCKLTAVSDYYTSTSEYPKDELGVRPAMMLAGSSLQQVYAMIDRGVAADGSKPEATAYLMNTSDKARNVRSHRYPIIQECLSDKINIEQIDSDVLKNKDDVMFYFTGKTKVDAIDSNRYLPGAIADHLTSTGGRLMGGRQMSVLRWLDAGATASYGTVVEPCAFTQKFPYPGIVIEHYLNGESLIEAYWKSVARPGQGVFVGEPLAAPYADSVH
ncbi:MAG: TIGR03790 family protein [Gammaproteobacteria bacterium]